MHRVSDTINRPHSRQSWHTPHLEGETPSDHTGPAPERSHGTEAPMPHRQMVISHIDSKARGLFWLFPFRDR